MSNDNTREQARLMILSAARRMLSGDLSYLEGAREICTHGALAGLDDDPDLVPFADIDSETDAFPIGAVRALWNADALKHLQPKMDDVEAWARLHAMVHCQALVKRLAE